MYLVAANLLLLLLARSPFSLHHVGNEACSSIATYSFHPRQGLFWPWRPFDTLRSPLGIFPSAIVAELFTQF